MQSNQHLLDTTICVETPEAIDIVLRVASVHARARAFGIDLLIRTIWLFISVIIISIVFSNEIQIALITLNLFFTFWLYPVIFEIYNKGQTPGKKACGIKVVTDNGTPINWSASLLRNLTRIVDSLPIFYAVGMCTIILSKKSQRLGDMLSGSLVIYTDKTSKKLEKTLQNIPAIELPHALTLTEKQAIVSFAERHHTLSSSRQLELASILMQSLHFSSHNPVQTALGFAKTITGQQKTG